MQDYFKPEGTKDRQFYLTTIVSLAAFYSCYRFTKLQTQIITTNYQKRKVERSEVINNIQSLQNTLSFKAKSELVFVSGVPEERILYTTQPNLSGVRVKIPLLQLLSFRQPLFTNSTFNDTSVVLNQANVIDFQNYKVESLSHFTLKQEDCNHKITVNFTQDCKTDSALTFISSIETKRKLTVIEWLANGLTLFLLVCAKVVGFSSLTSVLSRQFSFKGIHLGYRESEFGIKASGLLSILGQVIYDKDKQEYRIDNPLLITISKSVHLTYINNKLKELYQRRNSWLVLSVILTLYLGRRIYKFYKSNQHEVDRVFSLKSGRHLYL